jgi:hypothetical protein
MRVAWMDRRCAVSEHEGMHVVFQQDNGELVEDVFEGVLDGTELPDSIHEDSVVSAHDVVDGRVPPDPEQVPRVSGVAPSASEPTSTEPNPAPPNPRKGGPAA